MFVFGFMVKIGFQRNANKKAQIKHLRLIKRSIIQVKKLTKKSQNPKCLSTNVHALQKEILQNQEEVEQLLASTSKVILDDQDL
jgi:hypothetical protein